MNMAKTYKIPYGINRVGDDAVEWISSDSGRAPLFVSRTGQDAYDIVDSDTSFTSSTSPEFESLKNRLGSATGAHIANVRITDVTVDVHASLDTMYDLAHVVLSIEPAGQPGEETALRLTPVRREGSRYFFRANQIASYNPTCTSAVQFCIERRVADASKAEDADDAVKSDDTVKSEDAESVVLRKPITSVPYFAILFYVHITVEPCCELLYTPHATSIFTVKNIKRVAYITDTIHDSKCEFHFKTVKKTTVKCGVTRETYAVTYGKLQHVTLEQWREKRLHTVDSMTVSSGTIVVDRATDNTCVGENDAVGTRVVFCSFRLSPASSQQYTNTPDASLYVNIDRV